MGQSYRNLSAWKKGIDLVTEIYRVTQHFPREELYGRSNQLRRAAISVPSNIADGQARFSPKAFHHFLASARGSLVEIETQIIIAEKLNYLQPDACHSILEQTAELGRILNGLIASIKPK